MDSASSSSRLIDLSLKVFWIIVYYPGGDIGTDFEIVSSTNLKSECQEIKPGAIICTEFGRARVQGVVVVVSDDYNELSETFNSAVERFRTEYSDLYFSKKSSKLEKSAYYKKDGERVSYRKIIKICDQETQTESTEPEDNDTLMRKIGRLEQENKRLKHGISDIGNSIRSSTFKIAELLPFEKNIEDQDGDESASEESSIKMVTIGSGGTQILRRIYNTIKWESYTAATRKLLVTLFGRNTLATHSLTGKRSPLFAFSDKEIKMQLDPVVVGDIVEEVTQKCRVSDSQVRNAITTKCADENKMFRNRMTKQQNSSQIEEKENSPVKKIQKLI